jgi:multisubunit Na+/H+ antiporter MnhF subunit
MNLWLWAALALVLALVPCGWVLARAEVVEGVVALQAATGISTLALLLVAQGLGRPSFYDLSLAMALLGFPCAILFAHFFERWL